MNVLFVTYDFPYPTNSGGKNRAYHLIKHTASNANVFLFSFVRDDYNPDHNNELFSLGVKKIHVTKRKKLTSLVNIPKTILTKSSIFKTLYFEKKVAEELLEIIKKEQINIVHFESSYTGFYIGSFLEKAGVVQVLGTENIEFMLYEDYAKNLKKFYLKPFIYDQVKKLRKEEIEMVQKSDAVTTITQQEADILKNLTGVESQVVANGIELKEFSYVPPEKTHNNILFVGNFMYFPNVDAINFFHKEVFPKLDKKLTVTIVGKKINEKFKFSDKRIICKDFVEDIISEYRNADVLVFPIRIGGGTNFKVLEAMALGVPIVAQPQRLAGLKAKDTFHFLSASKAEEYVAQIQVLYEDKKMRIELSKNARKLVEEQYSWDKIGRELLNVWRKAYGKS